MTRPYLLRRVKADPTIIDDLPDKIEIKQYYRLTSRQASLYQSVADDMMAKVAGSDGIERRGNDARRDDQAQAGLQPPHQLLHDRSPVGRRSGR